MLLGREEEQQTLARLLEAARGGVSGALAIAGEAGIGKSALLAYAEDQAAGMNVLRARGVQSEAHIPFAGLFELLRPALALVDQIPAPQAAALDSALALRPASAPGRFAVGAATLSLPCCWHGQPRARCSCGKPTSAGRSRTARSRRRAARQPLACCRSC